MSRSYRHFPYCNYRSSGIKRELRRHYQHSLRQKLKNPNFIIKNNEYKKVATDSWDIFCGSCWFLEQYLEFEKRPYYSWSQDKWIDDDYNEEESIKNWKKWYYWK